MGFTLLGPILISLANHHRTCTSTFRCYSVETYWMNARIDSSRRFRKTEQSYGIHRFSESSVLHRPFRAFIHNNNALRLRSVVAHLLSHAEWHFSAYLETTEFILVKTIFTVPLLLITTSNQTRRLSMTESRSNSLKLQRIIEQGRRRYDETITREWRGEWANPLIEPTVLY